MSARRAAAGEASSSGKKGSGGMMNVTVECHLEEARQQGEHEFTIHRNITGGKLVSLARTHFGLNRNNQDRKSGPVLQRRDWRLVYVGGKQDNKEVQKRASSVEAAGIEDGDRLRLICHVEDVDGAPQSGHNGAADDGKTAESKSGESREHSEAGGHHHHHHGKKRRRAKGDGDSSHSSHQQPESSAADEGNTTEGGAEGNVDHQTPKRTRAFLQEEAPTRRSARVRGICADVAVGEKADEGKQSLPVSPESANELALSSASKKPSTAAKSSSSSSAASPSRSTAGKSPQRTPHIATASNGCFPRTRDDCSSTGQKELVDSTGGSGNALEALLKTSEASGTEQGGPAPGALPSATTEPRIQKGLEDPTRRYGMTNGQELRYEAEELMRGGQMAKAAAAFQGSLSASFDAKDVDWRSLYDCRYQMTLCLYEMQRFEDCVREAKVNLDLCIHRTAPHPSEADARRLVEARSMVGDFLLITGKVEEAQKALEAAVGGEEVATGACVGAELSYIVSLCGGLEDTQPIEASPFAIVRMQRLLSLPSSNFRDVIDKAKEGNTDAFSTDLKAFLSNLGHPMPLPKIERALFWALGSQAGARGWRAGAKLICQHLLSYKMNDLPLFEHCNPRLHDLLRRLDGMGAPLRTYQEFKKDVLPGSPAHHDNRIRVYVECKEAKAINKDGAAEFTLEPYTRVSDFVNEVRKHFGMDAKSVRGLYSGGYWRLCWSSGCTKDWKMDRKGWVKHSALEDGDCLMLRYVKYGTPFYAASPTEESTEQPEPKKQKLEEEEEPENTEPNAKSNIPSASCQSGHSEKEASGAPTQSGGPSLPKQSPPVTAPQNQPVDEGNVRNCVTPPPVLTSAMREYFEALSVVIPMLSRGEMPRALEMIRKVPTKSGMPQIQLKLCEVVAHCSSSSVIGERSFDEHVSAKNIVGQLIGRYHTTFPAIIEAARSWQFTVFKERLESLLASVGEPLCPVLPMTPIYQILNRGQGHSGWRASAKRICEVVLRTSDRGENIGHYFEARVKEVIQELEDPEDNLSLKDYKQFKARMQHILSEPPIAPTAFRGYTVECSRHCLSIFEGLCEAVEPTQLWSECCSCGRPSSGRSAVPVVDPALVGVAPEIQWILTFPTFESDEISNGSLPLGPSNIPQWLFERDGSPAPRDNRIRVYVECKEDVAINKDGAAEFTVEPYDRVNDLLLEVRKHFGMDAKSIRGLYSGGLWRLSWSSGFTKDWNIERTGWVKHSSLKDGDCLMLRYVKYGTDSYPMHDREERVELEPKRLKVREAGSGNAESSPTSAISRESCQGASTQSGGLSPHRSPPMTAAQNRTVDQGGMHNNIGPPVNGAMRDYCTALNAAIPILDTGDMSRALEMLQNVPTGRDMPKIQLKLCQVVAHCGSVKSLTFYNENISAKSIVDQLIGQYHTTFPAIIEAARNYQFGVFKDRLGSLLASVGEPLCPELPMEAIDKVLRLGRGHAGWRASAKRICEIVMRASDRGEKIGHHYEGRLKELMHELDDTETYHTPRTFKDFKTRMQNILSRRPMAPTAFSEYTVECSRRCQRVFLDLCEAVEPALLMQQPSSTAGDFISIFINCDEEYAIRCAGAKEFSVDPKEVFPILARTLSNASTAASQSSASSGEPQAKKMRTEKPEGETAAGSEANQGASSSAASTASTEIIKGEVKAEGCGEQETARVVGTMERKSEMTEDRGTSETVAAEKSTATIVHNSDAASNGGSAIPGNADEGGSTEATSSCGGSSGCGCHSAVEEGYGRQRDFSERRRMNVGNLGFDLANSLGVVALFEGRISDAVRLLDRAAKLAYPKAIEPKLCAIVAHCGGVTDMQPFEVVGSSEVFPNESASSSQTSAQAKVLVAEMVREHGERFEQVVDAARNGEIAIFRALLHSLQASAGEQPLVEKLIKPAYTAMGAGRSRVGWRASAKTICNIIINASDGGMLIGRPFEASIKAMTQSLENPDDHEFPRSFADFKDKMKASPDYVHTQVEMARFSLPTEYCASPGERVMMEPLRVIVHCDDPRARFSAAKLRAMPDKTCQTFLHQTCDHFGLWEPHLWKLVWKKGPMKGREVSNGHDSIEAVGIHHDDTLSLVPSSSGTKRKADEVTRGGPRRRSSLDCWDDENDSAQMVKSSASLTADIQKALQDSKDAFGALKYIEAVGHCRRALELLEKSDEKRHEVIYDTRYNLICFLLELQWYSDAAKEADLNVAMCSMKGPLKGLPSPRAEEANCIRGEIYLLQGLTVEAIKHYKEVLANYGITTTSPPEGARLGLIIALCGGLQPTATVETCPEAKAQVDALSRERRHFSDVVNSARCSDETMFNSNLGHFLANQDLSKQLVDLLYLALGGRREDFGVAKDAWVGGAKVICRRLSPFAGPYRLDIMKVEEQLDQRELETLDAFKSAIMTVLAGRRSDLDATKYRSNCLARFEDLYEMGIRPPLAGALLPSQAFGVKVAGQSVLRWTRLIAAKLLDRPLELGTDKCIPTLLVFLRSPGSSDVTFPPMPLVDDLSYCLRSIQTARSPRQDNGYLPGLANWSKHPVQLNLVRECALATRDLRTVLSLDATMASSPVRYSRIRRDSVVCEMKCWSAIERVRRSLERGASDPLGLVEIEAHLHRLLWSGQVRSSRMLMRLWLLLEAAASTVLAARAASGRREFFEENRERRRRWPSRQLILYDLETVHDSSAVFGDQSDLRWLDRTRVIQFAAMNYFTGDSVSMDCRSPYKWSELPKSVQSFCKVAGYDTKPFRSGLPAFPEAWRQAMVPYLRDHSRRGPLVLGAFNGKHFDHRVLSRYQLPGLRSVRRIDPLIAARRVGRPSGLEGGFSLSALHNCIVGGWCPGAHTALGDVLALVDLIRLWPELAEAVMEDVNGVNRWRQGSMKM
ncbi:hypothetical protein FOL47_004754 [Perkinsus chesapeaki]|uniref:Uncharacterized protein n=1 Tax=Perkinsus chesapeaki TaxID=330153 RepID=A0A7J6N033_PERCH|nr:hypothetical protein FOL47_004754 [Perkinsus chesapeaki]